MFSKNFTVLISVYNNDDPHLFLKSLESIFNNTLLPNKILLVIDGPVNQSLSKIIEKYKKERIFETLNLSTNVGLAKALNLGLRKITTSYVIRADSDDINDKLRFQKLVERMDNSNYDLIGSYVNEVDLENKSEKIKKVPITSSQIARMSKYRNPINHMSIIFKTKKIIELGGYPEITLKEDYALWLKMIYNKCNIINISESLVTVNAGDKLIKRRTNFNSLLSEFQLYKFRKNKGFLDFGIFIFRVVIHLLPFSIKKLIFTNFLR